MASFIPPLGDALADWQRRIQANRDQVARMREIPEESDGLAWSQRQASEPPWQRGSIVFRLVRPEQRC